VTWKLFFALVPPIKWGGGKPAFIIALSFIGIITGVVGEVAEAIGCVIGIQPQITAITIVAIGTSLPDTFASMTAARSSEYADAAVGNVTGSNSVNVFLGLGLPWVISAMYASRHNKDYEVPAGKLGFTVAIFLICSIICFIILTLRRIIVKGELGGPPFSKYLTAAMCVMLWVIYILLSILNASGVI
jgi:solute carrier family 8 (sodium/calcium exchanger)